MHTSPDTHWLSELHTAVVEHLARFTQISPEPRCRYEQPLTVDSGAQTEASQEASQGRPQELLLQAGTLVVVVGFGVVAPVVVVDDVVVVVAGSVVVGLGAVAVVVVVGRVVVVGNVVVVLLVVAVVGLLVVVGGVVVVLPGEAHRPPAPHASQQLGAEPTHAVPPIGPLHSSALSLILHLRLPSTCVRQQVTAPSRPQVDFVAQRTTFSLHGGRSDLASIAAFVTWLTQLMYLSCSVALAQSHCSSAIARTAAT